MKAETPNILVTDDDTDFRETLCHLLAGRGYCTHEAGDGQEALDILEAGHIYLVISDMHMPRLTGLELLRQARLLLPQLPFILLSARPDPWLVEQAQQVQVYAVQPKPITRRLITTLVNDALRSTYHWEDTPAD